MAWIDCAVDCLVEFGDHVVIVGRVHELEVASGNHRPLVFFRGKLCNLDRRTVPSKGHWQLDHYADW
jgi:flavin reductase (DIM6/NTAB) family NADH-FMN oxidoreductase RutF